MRAREFLTEAKLVTLDTDSGQPLRVWFNPSHSDLKQLLQKFDLRALVWPNQMIVWKSYDAVHGTVEDLLSRDGIVNFDDMPIWPDSAVLSNTGDFSDYDLYQGWKGEPREVNGIYYLSDNDEGIEKNKFFVRALGIK